MVGLYINTMKTTFLFKFWFLTSTFQITSLQVNKEKLLIDSFILVSKLMCIHGIQMVEIKIISSFPCIGTYDDDDSSTRSFQTMFQTKNCLIILVFV